jgi:hypothetical protein
MKKPTNKRIRISAGLAALGAAIALGLGNSAQAQELNVGTGDQMVHIMPTVSAARVAMQGPNGFGPPAPLTYHGGPVMTKATTYAIFWLPASGKLQNGGATSFSSRYQDVQKALLSLYPGHGIANNNTQYYSTTCVGFLCTTNYIQNAGGLGGTWVDTQDYPASGCADSLTPGNCLSDAQIQAEIQHALTKNPAWVPGINSLFFLFTSSGEGSCKDGYCAYTDYCAYHGFFTSGSTPILYANIPYGNAGAACQIPGTPSPNNDPVADAAATAASHELTEAITDPELNAWKTDAFPYPEIGDLCAYNYAANTWDSGQANQSWPVTLSPSILGNPPVYFFELQQEFDNHAGGCVQMGP